MKIVLFILLFGFFVLAYLMNPTEKQIQSCIDATGWTVEHCKNELTK